MTDALVSGDTEGADRLIEAAEGDSSPITYDGEFNVPKLMVLAADPGDVPDVV